jgi:hypothetical protein
MKPILTGWAICLSWNSRGTLLMRKEILKDRAFVNEEVALPEVRACLRTRHGWKTRGRRVLVT